MWCRPSTNAGQRRRSYQRASAPLPCAGSSMRADALAIEDLPADQLQGPRTGVEVGGELVRHLRELRLAVRREPVEAARAALGVLPLARDEALGLERAQERVHRVRVHGDEAAGDVRHALDELVAVGRAGAQEVQDEQRQQPVAAQLAEQRIGAAGRALALDRAGGRPRRIQRRGLGDGLLGVLRAAGQPGRRLARRRDPYLTTSKAPRIQGWIRQEYAYLPAFRSFGVSATGFGLPPSTASKPSVVESHVPSASG